jgi:hypothetical protein
MKENEQLYPEIENIKRRLTLKGQKEKADRALLPQISRETLALFNKLDFLCRQSLEIFEWVGEEDGANKYKTSLSILATLRSSLRNRFNKPRSSLRNRFNKPIGQSEADIKRVEEIAKLVTDVKKLSLRIYHRVNGYTNKLQITSEVEYKDSDTADRLKEDVEKLEKFVNQAISPKFPQLLFPMLGISAGVLGSIVAISSVPAFVGLLVSFDAAFSAGAHFVAQVMTQAAGGIFLASLSLCLIIGAAYWLASNLQEIGSDLTLDSIKKLREDGVFKELMERYPETQPQKTVSSKKLSVVEVIGDGYQSPVPMQNNKTTSTNQTESSSAPVTDQSQQPVVN